MAEKRMLIVDAEVARKVDENRGDMSPSQFLQFLIDSRLKEDHRNQDCVGREEFHEFQRGIKDLLRSFLDFFISFGLELGREPRDKTFEELGGELEALDSSASKK